MRMTTKKDHIITVNSHSARVWGTKRYDLAKDQMAALADLLQCNISYSDTINTVNMKYRRIDTFVRYFEDLMRKLTLGDNLTKDPFTLRDHGSIFAKGFCIHGSSVSDFRSAEHVQTELSRLIEDYLKHDNNQDSQSMILRVLPPMLSLEHDTWMVLWLDRYYIDVHEFDFDLATVRRNVEPNLHPTDQLIDNIREWAHERQLDQQDPQAGFVKVTEEVGEVAGSIARNNREKQIDSIGDLTVTVINLATQLGLKFEDCLQYAYDQIKDRSGKIINGVYVKDADLDDRTDHQD